MSSTTANFSPAVGTASRPETSTGHRRAGLVDRAALVVEQGADAAEAVAADDDVADLEGAVLDQDGRHDEADHGEDISNGRSVHGTRSWRNEVVSLDPA